MPEFNTVAILLIIALLLLWNLDFIATILTLGSLKQELPEEFIDIYNPEKYSESQEYTRATSRFGILSSIASLTILLSFWLFGGFAWWDSCTRSLGLGGVFSGLVYVFGLLLGNYILSLPLTIYATFVLEARFGFNKTTRSTFVMDQLKTVLLTALIGAPLLAAILLIFQNVPNAWLWAWLAFSIFILAITYLAPSLIMPLFNKFEPMEEGSLKDAIYDMAEECEFPLTEITIMDGSRRSAKSNAFFMGFGKNKKIALYDTLVENHSTEELVAVLAHEIGHFKRKHIIQRIVLSLAQFAILFYLLGQLIDPEGSFSRQLFAAFGIPAENISPHAGLVFFGILFSPVSRFLGVFLNAWSRKHEFEADAYAAGAQRTPEHLITALKKLSADNLSNLTPHRFRVLLDYSHPPVLVRIHTLRKLPPGSTA
ncbi:MAG TPA: peptidase M48 [Verrucomicrobiales bacterium]|nr:peptidase M48 [Verrucomicrobiales bacterium]|tara:strand:+ start:357 stop:1634 length:1278 start_codon:yes stop_codon:yes gene_type:complete